jgi:hypothetical protein
MIESIYSDLNIKARNWLILGYSAGALESLLEKLADIKEPGDKLRLYVKDDDGNVLQFTTFAMVSHFKARFMLNLTIQCFL